MGDSFWYKAQNSYDHRTRYGRSMPCKGHELDRGNTDHNYLVYVEKTNNINNNTTTTTNNNESEEMIVAVNAIYAVA